MNVLESVLQYLLQYGPQIVGTLEALKKPTLELIDDVLNSGALSDDDYNALLALRAQYDADFESAAAQWSQGTDGEMHKTGEAAPAEDPE